MKENDTISYDGACLRRDFEFLSRKFENSGERSCLRNAKTDRTINSEFNSK